MKDPSAFSADMVCRGYCVCDFKVGLESACVLPSMPGECCGVEVGVAERAWRLAIKGLDEQPNCR